MKTVQHVGNLSSNERAWSALGGAVLSVLVLRRSALILRSLATIAGLGLIARSVAGHCAVKAAISGKSSWTEGLQDQWKNMTGGGRRSLRRAPETELEMQDYVEERAEPEAVKEGVGGGRAASH